jgi:hypothetical protein
MRVLLLATLLVLAGCGFQEAARTRPATTSAVSEAMCLFTVDYDGHQYVGSAVLAPPAYGKPLGQATVPACNDTPGSVDDTPEQSVEVVAIKGAAPEIAIALRDASGSILIRDDVDRTNLPPALAKLMPPR